MTARARTTDPETSHLAAESVSNYTELQRAIITALTQRSMCDEQIQRHLEELGMEVSPSGVRGRRNELCSEFGPVESWDNHSVILSTGNKSQMWRIKPKPTGYHQRDFLEDFKLTRGSDADN